MMGMPLRFTEIIWPSVSGNSTEAALMVRKQLWFAAIFAVALLQCARLEAYANPNDAPKFAPGQMWSLKAPATAKVIIDRIEPWHKEVVVHVSIVDVPVPQGLPGAGKTIVIGHMPFEESALAASVGRVIATGVPPPLSFGAGYKQWQDAQGGIFTVSVEKAIEIMFRTMNRRQG